MNHALVFKLIGNVLKIEALFLVISIVVSIVYGGEDLAAFLYTIVILLCVGQPLSMLKPKVKNFRSKDAFAAAALTWIFVSFFGALPFYFSGYFASFVDCLFESVSGFTTTGATVLMDIEILPKGILFWRNFSHLIGGMGVLVFIMAVMPSMNASSVNLLRAESTGPVPGKVVPKIQETARVMYAIYLSMTIILIMLLTMCGIPFFDAMLHAFSTAGTGGLSSMNASIGAYNNAAAEIVISIFVLLFGVNFTLYFHAVANDFKSLLKDEELRVYAAVTLTAIIVVAVDILELYPSIWVALRHASFQVSSMITTTGFTNQDFNLWPVMSRVVLTFIMITGCCAGSTGGGIKLVRFLILFKAINIEINKIIHPKGIKTVLVNGKRINSEVVANITMFLFAYFSIFAVSTLLVSLDGYDIVSNVTAVVSMLSNAGPGLEMVGPTGNYAPFSAFSKIVFTFCMLAGRLEFFPVLVLFKPMIWRSAPRT